MGISQLGGFGSICLDKDPYGQKTYESINSLNHALLKGTTVKREARAVGSITAKDATVGSIVAGEEVDLTNTTCFGTIETPSYVVANISEKLGEIRGHGFVDLKECKEVHSIQAKGIITLDKTHVLGDAFTLANVEIRDSQIDGKLTCSSNHLVVKSSEVKTLELRWARNKSTEAEFTRPMKAPFSEGEKPLQILELQDCKVQKVIFEGGNGEVVLLGTSSTPEVVGGKIRKKRALSESIC